MAKIKIVTAPESYEGLSGKFVFLAGTIDNGDSYDWQKDICDYAEMLDDGNGETIIIFNPRRKDWNPNATDEDIRFQIRWELGALKRSNLILMNILESSKSPITLLEMGLFKDCPGLVVFCPEKFYRFTNVDVTCNEFGIKLYKTGDIDLIKEILSDFIKDQSRKKLW